MSPRFERRPDKRAGTGGRPPSRPGPRARFGRPERPARGEWGERADRGERGERSERPQRRERGEWSGGRDRGERGARPDVRSSSWQGQGPPARGRGADSAGERGERGEPARFRPRRSDGERPRPAFRSGPPARQPRQGSFGARQAPYDARAPRQRTFQPRQFGRDQPILRAAPDLEVADRGEAERHGEDQPSDLIWGRHAAAAALESGRPVHRIWCTPELRFRPPFLQALREAKAAGVLVEEVTWARLGQITGGAVHQGIVLQPAAADTLDLPSLIEGCRSLGEPPLLMALDGITDPHNLGAIARSAEALGAHGLVLPQRRSAGLTGSVAKVAAGALEHLPVARVVNLNRALDTLKQEGYRVVGLAAEGSVNLHEADLDGPLVIVTGSEGDGLSLLTRRHCDQLVRIPLRGATPSLNASVATAMVLYEVARRSWMKDLSSGQPAPRLQRPRLSAAPAEPGHDQSTLDQSAPDQTALDQTAADDGADSVPDAGTMV